MNDAEKLIELCDKTGDLDDTSEYQLLIRLLKGRTIIHDDGTRCLRKKEEVENPSEVLLNPSDPEATFRYKAGGKNLGYVGNVVEAVGEKGSLIIGADSLGNLQRLSNALEAMSGKMADVEQKLSNVEHQLETAKVEVTKPFPQEAELKEKLERLSELNALLNMDKKGDAAMVMGDDEPENDEPGDVPKVGKQELVTDEQMKPVAGFKISERIGEHEKDRMLADGSKSRIYVKEKLAEMSEKAYGKKLLGKMNIQKIKKKHYK